MLNQLDRLGKITLGLAVIGLTVIVAAEIMRGQAGKVRRLV